MDSGKNIVLILLMLLLIINGWLHLFWIGLERTVFNRDYHQKIIMDTGLITVIHEQLQQTLPSLVTIEIPQTIREDIDEDMAGRAAETIPGETDLLIEEAANIYEYVIIESLLSSFNPGWFKEQLLTTLDGILNFIKGNKDTVILAIDLRSNKDHMNKSLTAGIKTLPEETLDALSIEYEEIETIASLAISEIDLPDQLTLDDFFAEKNLHTSVKEILQALQKTRSVFLCWPYILFFMLLFFTVIFSSPGTGLMLAGTATIFYSISFLIGMQLFGAMFTIKLPGVTDVIFLGLTIPADELNILADTAVSEASLIPLLSLVLGFILVVGGFIYNRLKSR